MQKALALVAQIVQGEFGLGIQLGAILSFKGTRRFGGFCCFGF